MLSSFLYKTFFTFLLTLLSIKTEAQFSTFHFHHLGTENNLCSQSYNYYLFKDSKGFIWISSANGLSRFDGIEVRQYHSAFANKDSLVDENIHSHFFEDQNSDIWFSTNDAIHRYIRKKDHFERHFLPKSEETEYQVMLLDTLNDGLWVRNDQELYFYETSSRQSQHLGHFSFNHRSRMAFRKGHESVYLFIPENGDLRIVEYEGIEKKMDRLLGLNLANPDFYVSYSFYEDDEHLWLAADRGLIEVNILSGDFQVHRMAEGEVIDGVSDIVSQEVSNRLIVSTGEKGVHFFDKEKKQFIGSFFQNHEEGLAPFTKSVYRMYLDDDQTLWMHVRGKGIYYTNLQKRKFATFLQKKKDERQSLNHIKNIRVDSVNRIWCLSRNGITVLDEEGAELKRYLLSGKENALLNGNDPFHLFFDSKKRVWLSSQKGLFVLTNPQGAFKKVDAIPRPKKPGVSYVTELSNGKILASSLSNGVFEIDEQDLTLRPFEETRPSKGMYTWIYELNKEKVFFYKDNTQLEIYQYQGDSLVHDTTIVFKSRITAFVEDPSRERLWLPSIGGLFYMDLNSRTYAIQKDSAYTQRNLLGALLDAEGRLWMSSKLGLFRYAPDSGEVVQYDKSDGLQHQEFNFWSFAQTKNGKFIFGGVDGINMFDPLKVKEIKISANPEISKILINDASTNRLSNYSNGINNVSEIQELILPYDSNTISFNFAALEYSHPDANEFKFQMENIDDALVYNQNKNFVRYPNIPPGKYTFRLWASNSDGVWSAQSRKLKLNILPPWWQTWQARLAGLIIIGLLLYSIYRYRVAQIRRQETFLRKEAEYKQMLAETETAILRLQMNPHFIFNSLNSISSYILQEDTDKAYDYLVDFSKLMRMILNFAEQPFIALTDEIELLKRYIKTEAMRFEKEIDFQVDVAEELDAEELQMPTMILQPFVENAILHGLTQKKEAGLIKLTFQMKDNSLLCIIEDNGLGRKAARNVKQKQHQSKALKITERRLKLLSEQKKVEASFEIKDLIAKNGASLGTQVCLKLPLV